MFNLFRKNVNKISTNGYYIANYRGVSEEFNTDYDLYYMIMFNAHGVVAFVETEDSPYKISVEEFNDFLTCQEFDLFENFTNYELENNNIKMKFYTSNRPMSETNKEIDPNQFRLWEGTVVGNGMILSFCTSNFNYTLDKYIIDYYFKDLKFKFCRM